MVNKFASICAHAILVLLVLSATACSGIPSPINPAQPPAPAAPTDAPTPAPTFAPAPATTPEASTTQPQRGAPGIESTLKNLGLIVGSVRARNTQGVALQTPKGNEKIRVDASATIVIPGKTDARLSDLKTGDRVVAKVKDSTASFLLVLPKDASLNNLILGAVQTNVNGQITLRTRAGQDELKTSATTIVIKNDQGQISTGVLSEVKPASAVLVIRDDSNNAQVVVALAENARDLLGKAKSMPPQFNKGGP